MRERRVHVRAHGQHRAVRLAHHLLGDRAEQRVRQPAAAVRADDDEVDAELVGGIGRSRRGWLPNAVWQSASTPTASRALAQLPERSVDRVLQVLHDLGRQRQDGVGEDRRSARGARGTASACAPSRAPGRARSRTPRPTRRRSRSAPGCDGCASGELPGSDASLSYSSISSLVDQRVPERDRHAARSFALRDLLELHLAVVGKLLGEEAVDRPLERAVVGARERPCSANPCLALRCKQRARRRAITRARGDSAVRSTGTVPPVTSAATISAESGASSTPLRKWPVHSHRPPTRGRTDVRQGVGRGRTQPAPVIGDGELPPTAGTAARRARTSVAQHRRRSPAWRSRRAPRSSRPARDRRRAARGSRRRRRRRGAAAARARAARSSGRAPASTAARGSGTPSSCDDQAPAAMTTCAASRGPSSVSTPVTRVPVVTDAAHLGAHAARPRRARRRPPARAPRRAVST